MEASQTDWFYTDANDDRVGPITIDELRASRQAGTIDDEAYIWHETACPDWVEFVDLPPFARSLIEAVAAAPPAPVVQKPPLPPRPGASGGGGGGAATRSPASAPVPHGLMPAGHHALAAFSSKEGLAKIQARRASIDNAESGDQVRRRARGWGCAYFVGSSRPPPPPGLGVIQ